MDDDQIGSVQGTEVESTPGQNPAWESVLSVLPDEFHSVVTPHFAEWDKSAQSRIEQANQTAKQYEGFQSFVDNGIEPSELEQGLRLMYEIGQNPAHVVQALQEAYGLNAPQLSNEEEEEEETPDPYGPQLNQLQEGFDLVAQTLLSQQQEKVNAEAERQLEQEITDATEKHGAFDVNYVLSLMAVDPSVTMESAIGAYKQLTQNILQQNPRPFAPSVMGNSSGGTGLPSQAIDPVKLDDKGRRNLVAEMLKAEFGPQK